MHSVGYRLLRGTDLDEIMKLYAEDIVERHPILKAIKSPEAFLLYQQKRTKEALTHNVSLGAYDCGSGKLVGVAVGRLPTTTREARLIERPQELRQFDLLEQALIQGNVAEAIGCKNYIEYSFLAVKSEYAKYGIATELSLRMHQLAKDNKCEKAYVIATAHYTQRIGRKQGFNTVRSIAYKDYVDPITGKKIFENIPPPHDRISLEVKTLAEHKSLL